MHAETGHCNTPNGMQNCVREITSGVIVAFTHQVTAGALDALIGELRAEASFAVVAALTATAKDIEAAESQGLEDSLDRPTPFTLRAFGTEAATKARLQARVFMRPIQSRYLQWQIDGGLRSYKAMEFRIRGQLVTAYAMPRAALQLDQYGNVPRATLTRIIRDIDKPGAGARYFVGQPKGQPDKVPGIYERDGRALHLLFAFKASANYKPAFQWERIGMTTADARFPINLAQALAKY